MPGELASGCRGLLQQTDMIRCRGIDKARRLLVVDGLLKTAMEKYILDVKLVNRP
jgi:hypothetical protein